PRIARMNAKSCCSRESKLFLIIFCASLWHKTDDRDVDDLELAFIPVISSQLFRCPRCGAISAIRALPFSFPPATLACLSKYHWLFREVEHVSAQGVVGRCCCSTSFIRCFRFAEKPPGAACASSCRG